MSIHILIWMMTNQRTGEMSIMVVRAYKLIRPSCARINRYHLLYVDAFGAKFTMTARVLGHLYAGTLLTMLMEKLLTETASIRKWEEGERLTSRHTKSVKSCASIQ